MYGIYDINNYYINAITVHKYWLLNTYNLHNYIIIVHEQYNT